MKEICSPLEVEKLNATANHPQCNGLTEDHAKKTGSHVWTTMEQIFVWCTVGL